jgi:archaellum component FlaC
MNWNDRGDDNGPGGIGDPVTGRSDADEAFARIQAETAEVDYEGLLNDPEYVEFLEAFGEFEMPSDGDMEISELVEADEDGGAADDGDEGTQAVAVVDDRPASSDRNDTPALVATTSADDAATDGGSAVVDEFIAAVADGDVSEGQRAELREALGLGPPRRVEVQLNHLKSRFLDLEAYIRAMEDLLDAGADPIGDIESLEEDVDSIRGRLELITDDIEALETELAEQRAEQSADVEALADDVAQLRTSVSRDVSVLARELRSLKDWRERLQGAMEPDEHDGDTGTASGNAEGAFQFSGQ